MKKPLREYLVPNAANCITFLNMMFGSLSILSSVNGRFNWAIACVGFAAIADRYDGVVARHFKTEGPLGVQLDSMGDVISFGVAPGLLAYLSIYQFQSKTVVFFGGIVTVLFICAGAFRLARYNVQGLTEDNLFTGVPITIAGAALSLLLLLRRSFPPYFFMGVMVLLAFLMVSRLQIKKQ